MVFMPRSRFRIARCVASLALLLGACRQLPAATFTLGQARELGPMPQSQAIKGRDGGYSGRFGGRSVWLFGDTILAFAGEDGTSWRNNTASITADRDAAGGIDGFSEATDAKGAPREFLPQTAEEQAFNFAHSEVLRGKDQCEEPCGARWALWPGPIVEDADRGRALIVYTKIYGEPGEWNFHSVGIGLATWAGLDKPVERPEISPGAPHPTLLFQQNEPSFGSAAVVKDGYLYLFGCHGSDKACRLARSPLDKVLQRPAWSFYAGAARWATRPEEAAALFAGMDMTSVHWSSYLQSWIAVYSPPFDNRLMMRTALQLVGPWSEPVKVVDAVAPYKGDEFAYSGLGHAEYARDGGRFEYVSYYRSTAPWQGEIRLVELALTRRP
jgi:hypothetical protein